MICLRGVVKPSMASVMVAFLLFPHASFALQMLFSTGHYHYRGVSISRGLSPNCVFNKNISRSHSCHRNRQLLKLFTSLGNNFPQLEQENSSNGNKKSPRKWRQSIQSIKRTLVMFVELVVNAPAEIKSHYEKLTTRGRITLLMQLVALGLVLGTGIKISSDSNSKTANRPLEVSYSTFLDLVDVNGKGHTPGKNPALKLENVVISKDRVRFKVITDAEKHARALLNQKLVQSNDVSVRPIPLCQKNIYAIKPYASQDLIDRLRVHNVAFRAASTHTSNNIASIARFSILAIYLLFLRKMYQTMNGGGNGRSGGSEAPGKLATFSPGESLVRFEDIEGIDDAKFEVMELVDTLRNPKKYEIMGARAPTGLLLDGPPGTGKTMLARATAATAGVPLLYCSGSDFVEMFVGRGAARVRNTFSRAARLSPCIIFIDELDALGKSRDLGGPGANRSNDEAEQTLNQLLACMDGLDSSRRICVLAATNRREVLDPALIRPGRFDRIIKVMLPDVQGRERILRVHAKKLPGFTECKGVDEKRFGSLGVGASVDLSAVAAVTKGLCGADLEFIVNEAAIRAYLQKILRIVS
ncbi:hypothetical protein ACHAXA_007876 [Cyclostephanos tholiformis]|uniref:AAA+ ATPase domain-containing protein n=1 Tax=Cyclostephanos tholiformis TaxID=382380 RepID=A0ABD3R3H9_9STRA